MTNETAKVKLPCSVSPNSGQINAWVLDAEGDSVALCDPDAAQEIMTALNSHPALVEAARDVEQYLITIRNAAERIGEATAIDSKIATLRTALEKVESNNK